MRPLVFDVKVDLHHHTATGRIANGSRRGKRIKIWVGRNIAGDYHARKIRVGLFADQSGSWHGPVLRIVTNQMLNDYAVAKHVGKR